MIKLIKSQLQSKHQQLKKGCENRVAEILDDSYHVFERYFPEAMLNANGETLLAKEYFEYKNHQVLKWTNVILMQTIDICSHETAYDFQPDTVHVSDAISKIVLQTILKILSYNRDLCDNDYYFISDVSNAMGFNAESTGFIIESAQSEIRKSFFKMLVHFLSEEQCLKCAILLYSAIKADNYTHPAEFKYFENISQLVRNDQQLLEQVKQRSQSNEDIKLTINEELSKYIFKYLIEIVMCDGQFDTRESKYLKEIGQSFGLDYQQQDEIIQPVASLQMVHASLFPQKIMV